MSGNAANDNTPAQPVPPGVTPEFNKPTALGTIVIIVLTLCLVITLISTVCRIHAQLRLFGRFIWTDFFIIVAQITDIIFTAILLSALPLGFGRHPWNISKSRYIHLEHRLYVSYIFYHPTVLFAKLGILHQFIRIFSGTYRNRFWYACIGLGIFNILFYVSVTFLVIFTCSPVRKIWDPTVPGHCVNEPAVLMVSGPFNVVSDFQLFLLPIWAIWSLQLPLKKRFSVSTGFAIGFLGCACSGVRTAYSVRLLNTNDFSYRIAENQMWADAECTLAIIIANSIIIPRYFRSFQSGHRRTGSTESSTNFSSAKTLWWGRRKAGGKQTGQSSGTLGNFTWDDDDPLPEGEDFHKLTNSLQNPDPLHSRLSEEMDLTTGDRKRVAPWSEPKEVETLQVSSDGRNVQKFHETITVPSNVARPHQ